MQSVRIPVLDSRCFESKSPTLARKAAKRHETGSKSAGEARSEEAAEEREAHGVVHFAQESQYDERQGIQHIEREEWGQQLQANA